MIKTKTYFKIIKVYTALTAPTKLVESTKSITLPDIKQRSDEYILGGAILTGILIARYLI